MPVNIVLEIAGAAMLLWVWRTNELSKKANRDRFVSSGRLVGATTKDVGQC
jgi:hypothetical protein